MRQEKKTIVHKRIVHKKNDQRDWGLLFLVLAIFLFVGALFIEGERGSNEQSSVLHTGESNVLQQKNQTLRQLDYDLKDSAMKDELYKNAVRDENASAERIDEETALGNSEHLQNINPLVFDQENSGKKVLKDTDDNAAHAGRALTPEQRISAKVQRDQWVQDYERRQKAEFVKQFLENAKRNGVDIRLNENLDVTGIDRFEVEKPIRIPQSENKGGTGGNK